LWRGTEIPQEIKDHPSYDYHKFVKLPFEDSKTKDLVTEYWMSISETGSVEGLSA
jgi:elongation factor 1-gamma